ncbi:MAG: hypothetical protein ACFFCS_09430 [Candidatus Hodarchaeota archaeon]
MTVLSDNIKFFSINDIEGRPYVIAKLDDRFDNNLASCFLAAVYSFGTHSMQDQMSKISIEGCNLRLESFLYNRVDENSYISIGMISQEISKTDFSLFSEQMIHKFDTMYRHELEAWDGEITVFSSFENIIKRALENYFSPNMESISIQGFIY